MIRKIIQIDRDKCVGCGLCVRACHEGAIAIENNKAVLLRDDYCDGLGNCLPSCPTDAISFIEREALPYDVAAVQKRKEQENKNNTPITGGCPGSRTKIIRPTAKKIEITQSESSDNSSELTTWPIQLKLVAPNASFFDGRDILIAADCTAYAYRNFHNKFMKNKITLIGCPKLDEVDYSNKLTKILEGNDIKSITIVRMEVPCCSGIVNAVKTAFIQSQKMIPWQIVTISTNGELL